MDHFAFVVEDIGGDKDFAFSIVMLSDYAVEAADGVVGQVGHGPAHVKDKYQFGEVFLHILCPFSDMLFCDHDNSIS